MEKRCEKIPKNESGTSSGKVKRECYRQVDRGFHFLPEEIEEELKKGGAKNIEDVWIFPPNAGKLCNPLDNTLWHS